MSDDLLPRLERAVRRFGGPLPVDDLLPELDAEASVYLSSGESSEESVAVEGTTPVHPAAGWRELGAPAPGEHADNTEDESAKS